ncbi:Bifunctional arginine demethylase and lysyl-hydroxylase JMJD6-A [Porphyridium purpureum]|uniref:Bifunctional arginine demethylase and lysyl-hydroxylase JMJD6-A n=1 Tax=Porphyridium purpureum TaxID=35688 RepID=A0A5J4Z2I8_PORPP|nr:Bifunctional arginine demethylase and lysyl-hydroxylase JMJD6-A [Porphyridium purpureum]|eukprot:POR2275..scf208_2
MNRHERRLVEKAKRGIRTDLRPSEWSIQGYAWDAKVLNEVEPHGVLAVELASELSLERFRTQYEAARLPLVIRGAMDKWPAYAQGRWALPRIDARFRHVKMRCGEDDDGAAVRLKIKYFLRYCELQRDDSPLYIFDSKPISIGSLRHDYQVPEYFKEDLFAFVPEPRRPPHKWFLIGPKRSGSNVHIDPLATSAWNALIAGKKRWIFFPPGTSRKVVKAKYWMREGEDDEPIDYFTVALPRMKRTLGDKFEYIEFIQKPGEIVFVPGGWWHAVLNLEDSVAVTHNFCSSINFKNVWVETRTGRRGMARRWLAELAMARPDLVEQACALNSRDGYDMEAARVTHHREYRAQMQRRRAKRHMQRMARKRVKTARAVLDNNAPLLEEEDQKSSSSSVETSSTLSSLSQSGGYQYSDDDLLEVEMTCAAMLSSSAAVGNGDSVNLPSSVKQTGSSNLVGVTNRDIVSSDCKGNMNTSERAQ